MTNRLEALTRLADQCDAFVVLAKAESTNDYVRNHFEADGRSVIVVTDTQTHGRGRLSRTWITRPGEALALSVGLPWNGAGGETTLSWLPVVVGATLVGALRDAGVHKASLKWPNDVLVGEGKLAGILCEIPHPGWVIIGVGINLDFPKGSPPSPNATALAHHGDFPLATLDSVMATFVTNLRHWVDLDHARGLRKAQELVPAVMGTLGRQVEVSEIDGSRWSGIARGLDDHGHLLVTPTGSSEPRVVVASDIRHLYQ